MKEWLEFIDQNFPEASEEMKKLLREYAEHHLMVELDLPEPPEETHLDKALVLLSTLDPSKVVISPTAFHKSLEHGKVCSETIETKIDCTILPNKDYGFGLVISQLRNKYQDKQLFVYHLFSEVEFENNELLVRSTLIGK